MANKGPGQPASSPVQVCMTFADVPLSRTVVLGLVRSVRLGKSCGRGGDVCKASWGVRENESCEVVEQCGRLSAAAVDVMYLVHSHRRVCHW